MRPNRIVLSVLAAVLGVELVILFTLPGAGEAERNVEAAPPLVVRDSLPIESHPHVLVATPSPGKIGFRLPDGWEPLGVPQAVLHPERDDRVDVREAFDVALLQDPQARLRLEKWVAARTPAGAHYLRFVLHAAGPAGTAYFVGWARFEGTDLIAHDILVDVQARLDMGASVVTRGGQGVPGALVYLCGFPPQVDRTSHALKTDAEGRLRVFGLRPDDTHYLVLPAGVGPYRERLQGLVPPVERSLTLTVPLSGSWGFQPVPVERLAPGVALKFKGPRPLDEEARCWAVSDFLLPGMRPGDPVYLMRPAHDVWRGRIELQFLDAEAQAIDLADVAQGKARLTSLLDPEHEAGAASPPDPPAELRRPRGRRSPAQPR